MLSNKNSYNLTNVNCVLILVSHFRINRNTVVSDINGRETIGIILPNSSYIAYI